MTIDRRYLLSLLAGLPAGAWAQERPLPPMPPRLIGMNDLLGPTVPALAYEVLHEPKPGPVQDSIADGAVAGVRRLGSTDRAGVNDLWHIGSNTKAMTAALYGRLVDQGKARWGATVGELFPDVKADPAWAKTTIEDLMSHRAGISDPPVMASGWLLAAHSDNRPLTVQRTELANKVFGAPPKGKPGSFEYSNVGFILAGAAIERICRSDWETAITERLFKPLGMKSAGFGAPTGDQPWGHAGSDQTPLTPVDPKGMADNPPALGPAGRVHLSLADYGRFTRLFLPGGGGFLKPETVAHLTTPAPGEGRPYALGWGVATPAWGRGPVIAHEGSNTMWHAVTLVAPARGVAIMTACNASPDASKRAAFTLAVRLQQAFAPA